MEESRNKLPGGRKKGIIRLGLLAAGILSLSSACALSKEEKGEAAPPSSVYYHNLAGEESQKEVERLLKGRIDEGSLQIFMEDVRHYNGMLEGLSEPLAGEYRHSETIPVSYRTTEIIDLLAEKEPDFFGNNCRISAFTLLQDYIQVAPKEPLGDMLIFDRISLEESGKFSPDTFSCFETFYDSVPTVRTKDIQTHVEKLQEYFHRNEIRFALPEGISLLSVVFHEAPEEDFLFVGHTGILVEEGDSYVFLEKLSFELPYQCIRFQNRQECSDYLMKMYDTAWGQETAPVIIMENDVLMPEYRQLLKETE